MVEQDLSTFFRSTRVSPFQVFHFFFFSSVFHWGWLVLLSSILFMSRYMTFNYQRLVSYNFTCTVKQTTRIVTSNFNTEQMNGNRSKNMYTNDKNYIHLKVKRHSFPFPISSRFFGMNPVESVKRHFYKGLRSGTKLFIHNSLRSTIHLLIVCSMVHLKFLFYNWTFNSFIDIFDYFFRCFCCTMMLMVVAFLYSLQ